MTADEAKPISEDHDYAYTVLYPFTFMIKEITGHPDRITAQCAEIPGVIMQAESLEHLRAEAIRVFDGWFEVSEQIRKENVNKK
jgi:hypothetical protein